MSFDVPPDSYLRFMGRFSEPLAAQFVDLAEVHEGQQALDVGCGPGVLTARLVERLGEGAVAAVDPSPPFVAATRERLPGVDVRSGVAERLPYPDASFDVVMAQLVVHFMTDPVVGLAEMARVARPGGVVAACVWDEAGTGPLAPFWRALRDVEPDLPTEPPRAGTREDHLVELFTEAGLQDAEAGSLTVQVRFSTFEQWWDPYTLEVGPAGALVARLDDDSVDTLRTRCAELLPPAPFEIAASAWAVRSRV